VVSLHLVIGSFKVLVLAEFALQVTSHLPRQNLNISDLHSLEPDAPTLQHTSHTLHDEVAQCVTVLDHLINRLVSDVVAHDRRDGSIDQLVRSDWLIRD